jgi:hypothetical protein
VVVTATATGAFTATLAAQLGDDVVLSSTDAAGNMSAPTTVTLLPPDPATVAPPLDPSVATTLATATAFLYTGPSPIQTGVAPGTIHPVRATVLRGKVLDRNHAPLPGVTITILNHPEFGQTLSRADGMFDLAANGGGLLTVKYEKQGFLPVQRQTNVPWQDYVMIADVVMIRYDPQVTYINLSANIPMQVAQGSTMTDGAGTRRATLLFPQGTTATMKLPDGSMQGLTQLHVRATEYTVGANGPAAMPGDLPANSGYTYAVDYSLDEAISAGAKDVTFSQAVISYEENFLGFPAGTSIPTGFSDPLNGRWVPSTSGRVVKVLSITGGQVNLDLDGSNTAASDAAYAALGVTQPERQQLATLYTAGQSLWRVPITHFSPWDKNWGFSPPPDAQPPKQPKCTGDGGPDHPT